MPKQLEHDTALNRIYHDDDMAAVDWSLIVDAEEPNRPVETEKDKGHAQCATEYLNATMQRNGMYAFPAQRETTDSEGQVQMTPETQIVQVLNKRGSHSRPHVMQTFDCADEPYRAASLSLEVQRMARIEEPAATEGEAPNLDRCRVFPVDDPVWVNVKDLAEFESLSKHMFTWGTCSAPDEEGVVVLSDKHHARPLTPIMHENHPTLGVIWALLHKGWNGENRTTIVDARNVHLKWCDTREAVRFKPYFQVLYSVDTTLPLTSCIPSQQPVKYYRLLLRGTNF